MGDTQTFNPLALWFIADSYGVQEPSELAPILNFPAEKLKSWSEGESFPSNDEVLSLQIATRIPVRFFGRQAA